MKLKNLFLCIAVSISIFTLAGCNSPDANFNSPDKDTKIVNTENQNEQPDDDTDNEKPNVEHHNIPHPDCPGSHKRIPHPRGRKDKNKPVPLPMPAPGKKK